MSLGKKYNPNDNIMLIQLDPNIDNIILLSIINRLILNLQLVENDLDMIDNTTGENCPPLIKYEETYEGFNIMSQIALTELNYQ